MSHTRTLLLAFAFVAVMAEASSRHKHGGLGHAQPGPELGATRFVCAHCTPCTATGELSSRGLFLNRASVLRHIAASKKCRAADLGYREIHVEALACDVMDQMSQAPGDA